MYGAAITYSVEWNLPTWTNSTDPVREREPAVSAESPDLSRCAGHCGDRGEVEQDEEQAAQDTSPAVGASGVEDNLDDGEFAVAIQHRFDVRHAKATADKVRQPSWTFGQKAHTKT